MSFFCTIITNIKSSLNGTDLLILACKKTEPNHNHKDQTTIYERWKCIKRVTVWVDCRDEKAEDVRHQIEKFLKSQGLTYKIVEVCQLVSGIIASHVVYGMSFLVGFDEVC